MQFLWTWSGECFGYRENNQLWRASGIHVGTIYDDEVYDHKGLYLGEILHGRLIRNTQKKYYRKDTAPYYGRKGAFAKYINYVGYVMYAGYEDFPLI